MDINPPAGKEVPLDVARELLIAISQSPPDDHQLCLKSDKAQLGGDNGGAKMNSNTSEDELRSKLISISYVPSPDKIVPPSVDILHQ